MSELEERAVMLFLAQIVGFGAFYAGWKFAEWWWGKR